VRNGVIGHQEKKRENILVFLISPTLAQDCGRCDVCFVASAGGCIGTSAGGCSKVSADAVPPACLSRTVGYGESGQEPTPLVLELKVEEVEAVRDDDLLSVIRGAETAHFDLDSNAIAAACADSSIGTMWLNSGRSDGRCDQHCRIKSETSAGTFLGTRHRRPSTQTLLMNSSGVHQKKGYKNESIS
jgi:hypothetical protein